MPSPPGPEGDGDGDASTYCTTPCRAIAEVVSREIATPGRIPTARSAAISRASAWRKAALIALAVRLRSASWSSLVLWKLISLMNEGLESI
jgi:hypothetical protein